MQLMCEVLVDGSIQAVRPPWMGECWERRSSSQYDYGQTKLLPISYERQILPGTFEHTLSFLIDNKIDLSIFDARYQNDAMGAPAYDLALLLKIVLFAYSKGIYQELPRLSVTRGVHSSSRTHATKTSCVLHWSSQEPT
jgi:hypothetical protein